MANKFSSGKHALGFCDRCSFRFPLKELKNQIVKQKETGLKVCPDCMDVDHPQLMLGMYPVSDPQAVRHPRPDPSMEASRVLVDQEPLSVLFVPPTP